MSALTEIELLRDLTVAQRAKIAELEIRFADALTLAKTAELELRQILAGCGSIEEQMLGSRPILALLQHLDLARPAPPPFPLPPANVIPLRKRALCSGKLSAGVNFYEAIRPHSDSETKKG